MRFSPREQEVLEALWQADGNRQAVCNSLCISDKTLKSHIHNLCQKNKAGNLTVLMLLFIKRMPEIFTPKGRR